MAKRKKLNRRVVILLLAMGAVVATGAVVLVLQGLPQDPIEAMARGRAAFEAGDYKKATGAFKAAIPGLESRGGDVTEALFPLSRAYLDWALKAPDLTDTDRREHYTRGMRLLRNVLHVDRKHREARSLLCDIYWEAAVRSRTNWKRFIDEADKLLELSPDDHDTRFRRALAKAYLAQTVRGEYPDEALGDFRDVINRKPDEPRYRMALAGFLQHPRINEIAKAEEVYLAGIEATPDSAEMRVHFARFLRRQHRKADALTQLKEAIQREPNKTVGLVALADFYAKEEMLTEAIKTLQAAKRIDDTDYRVYGDLAKVYTQWYAPGDSAEDRRGALQQAATALREGLDTINRRLKPNPGSVPVSGDERRRLMEARWRLNSRLANVMLDQISAGEESKEQLLAAVRECGTRLERMRAPTSYHSKIVGRAALAEGNVSEAITLLEKSHKLRFDSETATILINLYFKLDLPGKAEQLIAQFMSLPGVRPGPSVWAAYIKLLMRFHEFDRAERQVKKLLQQNENDQVAWNLALSIQVLKGEPPEIPENLKPSKMAIWLVLDRAVVLWIDDRRDEAVGVVEKLYDVVVRNAPEMVTQKLKVASRLISFYVAQGKTDKARAMVAKLVREHPGNLDLTYQQNLLAEQDPKKQLAIRLKMADALMPLEAALEKANSYALVGDREGYYREMQEAARVNPNAPGVIEGLFRHYVSAKDWDAAGKIAARAGEANVDGTGGRVYAARLAIAREAYSDAAKLLTEALKRRPELKNAWVMLGTCYDNMNEPDKAYSALRVVLSNDPSYVPALIEMAKVTEKLGKMHEHTTYLEQAFATSEGHADPYIRNRYWVLEGEKAKPEEIGKIIRNREVILKQDPTNLRNCLHLGRLYESVGQLDRAEGMYRYIYEKNRNRVNGARILVSFLARTKQSGEVDQIISELSKGEQDKVGVLILYAEFLGQYSAEQAQKTFEKAVKTDPKDPRGYLELGRFLSSQTKWAQAAQALEQYNRLRPEDLASEKVLIHSQIEARQFDSAAQRVNRILASAPSDAGALTLKALLMMKKRNFGAAEELLDQAIRENPAYVIAKVYRAQVHLNRDQVPEARDLLQRASQQTENPEVKMQLSRVQARMNAYDEAQATLRAIVDKHKDYTPAIQMLIKLYMRGKRWRRLELLLAHAEETFPSDVVYPMARAEMWRRRDDLTRAILALEKARAMAPNSWLALSAYLMTLVDAKLYDKAIFAAGPYLRDENFEYKLQMGAILGRVYVEKRQEAKADQAFVAALKGIPADQLELAVVQIERAYGLTRAIEKLKAWAPLRSKDWQILMLLGDMYRRARQYTEAADTLIKALRVVSTPQERAIVNRTLGSVYHEIGQKDGRYLAEAEKRYLAAIATLSDDIKALNNLAYLYTNDLDNPNKALEYIEGVYKREPNDTRVADTYGWTLAKLGRLKLAEQILVRSVQLGDPMPVNRFHLGWVYEQTTRYEKALNLYRQALALIGDRPEDTLRRSLIESIKRVESKAEPGSTP